MLVNLNKVLAPAKKGKYAVGLFNAVTIELTEGIFQAAEELNAPIIVGTAEIFNPTISMEAVADMLKWRAERSNIPVVLHYDHGLTFENCVKALKLGFSSIMYDCSTLPYEENIKALKEIVKIAHAMNVSVEGELGHVGNNEGSAEAVGNEPVEKLFTDVNQAIEYVKLTGVDALAVAVGNAHGFYKLPPKLDFALIEKLNKAVDAPLVLHGGSGLTENDFKTAISKGISKVNIFSEIDRAAAEGASEAISKGKMSALEMIPFKVEAVKKVVKKKIEIFGCKGVNKTQLIKKI